MNLYLMRHGIALPADDPSATTDADRPLTEKGAKRVRKAARGVRRLDISFDLILTSPILRARQTADIVAEALGIPDRLTEISGLAPESPLDRLLSDLTAHRNNRHLLLVGHEPLLSNFCAVLLTGAPANRAAFKFKKGGLCCIEIESFSASGNGRLLWFVTPKQLRGLGERSAKT